MIRQKISTNLETMDQLHAKHNWIPGSASIRPNAGIIEKKHNYITNMLTRYGSLQDFVLHRFFGLKTITEGPWNNSRMRVSDEEISLARAIALSKPNHHEFRFLPNLFTYQVPEGTNHYVLWFLLNGSETLDSVTNSPLTDEEINSSIEEALRQSLGSTNDKFSFVWYLNPKPTIVSNALYHVQVFWIP